MSVIFSGTEMESMYHDGTEVQTWIHNGVEVYTAGKMVTYVVDTNTTYEEKVKKGHSCLSPTTFTPTKSGWAFLGWRTDKTASSDVLTSKVMERSPITLYAVFKATITCYTYNGSSSRTSTSGTRYYNNGNYNNPTFKLTQNGISGWSANGWCTSNGATAGIAVANGGSVTLSGDATYYGRYSQTIYLYYNGNGNTGGSTGTQSGTRYFNSGNYSNPTFTIAWNGYSRTNATFINWALNGTGGTRYSAGSSITLSASATLYAKWTVTSTETATYSIPGGTYSTYGNQILAPTSMSGGGNILKFQDSKPYLSKAAATLEVSFSNVDMRIPGYSSGDHSTYKIDFVYNGGSYTATYQYQDGSVKTVDLSCTVSNVGAGSFYYQLIYISGYNGPRFESTRSMTVKATVKEEV